MIELSRRRFIHCLSGIISAPAVVRADSLMKIVRVPHRVIIRTSLPDVQWRQINQGIPFSMTLEEWQRLMDIATISLEKATR